MIGNPTTVTIPSGSSSTELISGSVFDLFSDITIYGPTGLDGIVTLETTPSLAVGETFSGSFFNIQDPIGTDVTIAATSASVLPHVPAAAAFRLTSDAAETAAREFVIVGRIGPRGKVLPPFDATPTAFGNL